MKSCPPRARFTEADGAGASILPSRTRNFIPVKFVIMKAPVIMLWCRMASTLRPLACGKALGAALPVLI